MSLALLSTMSWAAGMGVVRYLSSELHTFQIAFFAAFFGVLAMLPWLFRYGFQPFKTNNLGLYIFRGVLSTGGTLAMFYALSVTPIATVTALNFTMPIFTTLLAIFFLHEQVGKARWAAIAFAFAGVFAILRPGIEVIDSGSLLVIGASILFAGIILIIKVLTFTDSLATITYYSVLLRVPMALIPALFVWQWPNTRELLWLAAMGAVGTLSTVAFTQALKEVETKVVSPLFFLQLVWAAAIGYFFFAEVPDMFTWFGGAMIVSSITYIAYRESKAADSVS